MLWRLPLWRFGIIWKYTAVDLHIFNIVVCSVAVYYNKKPTQIFIFGWTIFLIFFWAMFILCFSSSLPPFLMLQKCWVWSDCFVHWQTRDALWIFARSFYDWHESIDFRGVPKQPKCCVLRDLAVPFMKFTQNSRVIVPLMPHFSQISVIMPVMGVIDSVVCYFCVHVLRYLVRL